MQTYQPSLGVAPPSIYSNNSPAFGGVTAASGMQTYQPSLGVAPPSIGAAAGASQTYSNNSPAFGGVTAASGMTTAHPSSTGGSGGRINVLPPPEVCNVAILQGGSGTVIAWTTFDPALVSRLSDQYRGMMFFLLCVPCCFWPCLWPWLRYQKTILEQTYQNQYWILTERDLKVVTMGGSLMTGNQSKSIPLDRITDCGIDSGGNIGLPSIYVDTASTGGQRSREAVGIGLLDQEAFLRKILHQRDIVVKGTTTAPSSYAPSSLMTTTTTATSAIPISNVGATVPMQRGGGTHTGGLSVTDRMIQSKELYDKGLISLSEYQRKRQDILSSV